MGQGTNELVDLTFFSSEDESLFETGFMMRETNKKQSPTSFLTINDRLYKIQLKEKHRNETVMNEHIQTGDKDGESKLNAYDSTPKFDSKIVIGD